MISTDTVNKLTSQKRHTQEHRMQNVVKVLTKNSRQFSSQVYSKNEVL